MIFRVRENVRALKAVRQVPDRRTPKRVPNLGRRSPGSDSLPEVSSKDRENFNR
jgi:hypothetical protein